MRKQTLFVLLIPVFLLVTPCMTFAGLIITVDDDGHADFDNIQAAINNAVDGDTVIVADGTYTGAGNKNLDFGGRAITVRSESGPEFTIIDCENSGRGFYFHNDESSSSVLEGVTIRNGYASGGWPECNGGAILCLEASPKISNCIITENSANGCGGGIYCGSLLKESNCIISNCVIRLNSAGHFGGGIYCGKGSQTIENCLIIDNVVTIGYGGGSCCWQHSNANFLNCSVIYNRCKQNGGGIMLRLCSATIRNCILWGNEKREIYPDSFSTAYVSYSDIDGGYGGEENINVDPCFVEAGYWDGDFWIEGDYHLLPDSPCIDAGDPCYVTGPNETDLDGNPRVIGGRIDMGAYEFIPLIEVPMKFTPQRLNLASQGKWVKAHFVLPEDFVIEDVDVNTPATIVPLGIESDHINVFINEDGLVKIEAAFSRADFCGLVTTDDTIEVMAMGMLTTGQHFYGTDTIRIISKKLEQLALISSYWLQEGCDQPDWCSEADLNYDSVVNFMDFALLDGCCIEIIEQ